VDYRNLRDDLLPETSELETQPERKIVAVSPPALHWLARQTGLSRRALLALSALWGVVLVGCLVVGALLFAEYRPRPPAAAALAASTESADLQPAASQAASTSQAPGQAEAAQPAPDQNGSIQAMATPACGESTLTVGEVQYKIEALARQPDGSLQVPTGAPGTAYWISGSSPYHVFALEATLENLALQASITGDEVAIAWSDCENEVYTIRGIENSPQGINTVFDTAVAGITLLVPIDPGSAGLVIHAQPPGEETAALPDSGQNNIQAEIGMLEASESIYDGSILTRVSIQNYGASEFTLSAADAAVSGEDGRSISPKHSDPYLPQTLAPGETREFEFVFPQAPFPNPVLRIFDVEYNLEDFYQ
jgi:hypothetical protein